MRSSNFIFDCLQLLYYKCCEKNLKRGGSYIDSPNSTKSKKTAINPINKKYNKCFQYTATVALNHEQLKKDPQRVTKIKLFIDKYNWEGINHPSEKGDF